MKIYVAGPYTNGGKEHNVATALWATEQLALSGHTPFCPLLFHFWDAVYPHTWEFWMKQCLEWLPTCDGLLRLPGESKGADIEVATAERLGLPVYKNLFEVPKIND